MNNDTDNQPVEVREEILLRWSSPEFIEYSRSWKWYTIAGSLVFLAIVYSIFARDWFIIPIAFILFGITIYYQREKPKEIEYRITQLGFYIDGKLYPYNQLHSFWFVIGNNLRLLNLVFTKSYVPQRTILFYGVDPVELREVLGKYIPEQEDRTENVIEKLARLLKI